MKKISNQSFASRLLTSKKFNSVLESIPGYIAVTKSVSSAELILNISKAEKATGVSTFDVTIF